MDRSVAIANEFLSKRDASALTQMQLQKLVFFAHGWTLAETGKPLTSDDAEAWVYGPVYRDLYDHTKFFGSKVIPRLITPDDDEATKFFLKISSRSKPYVASLSSKQQSIVDKVWKKYGRWSGPRLSSATHRWGTPWSITYDEGRGRNATIQNDLVESYFERQMKVDPL